MIRWLDARLGVARFTRTALKKVFPDHWSFLLGEVALFSFVILLMTGIFLTLFYRPDAAPVIYEGPYEPMQGREVSAAYESVLRLSFEVRAGLVMRQIHHWAALVFVASVVVHMVRIFFTAAFRKPRDVNWLVGIGLLLLAMAMGFTGYSLPDDLLSGTGLRIVYSVLMSVPFVGPYLAFLLFGGEFPAEGIISRLFVLHVMLLPAVIIGLITVHLVILIRQKHAQFPGEGRTERNVVGKPFWPQQAFKSLGLLFLTAAVLSLMGGLIQINPVWAYGPFDPTMVSGPAQPDWYIGWLEGALRLFPPFDVTIGSVTLPSPFIPGVVMPGIAFGIMAMWPFIEARVLKDDAEHQLLEYPRDNPLRLAIGVGGLLFFGILTLAAANDVLALTFRLPVNTVTNVLRIAVLVGPFVGGWIAYRVAADLKRGGRGRFGRDDGVRLTRNSSGGFN
ncbi:MAG: cytochrome bc1 complex cytochrome b subunit [Actinomycetota bacterium]